MDPPIYIVQEKFLNTIRRQYLSSPAFAEMLNQEGRLPALRPSIRQETDTPEEFFEKAQHRVSAVSVHLWDMYQEVRDAIAQV